MMKKSFFCFAEKIYDVVFHLPPFIIINLLSSLLISKEVDEMSYRHCSSCGRRLHRDSYSKTQWTKPVGISRCYACVESGNARNSNNSDLESQSARRNNATRATFTQHALSYPFAEGGFRYVAKGKYTVGERAGEECVCKWFKSGHVLEESFFTLDIQAADKALHIVKEWNSRNFINRKVMVNVPQVWTFMEGGAAHLVGKKVLQEPFIQHYTKFNSNSGWADDSTPWPRVMQALSHFSYHITSGQFVLCDLQGGIYSNAVVLTDPVILSRSKRFGVTDLGPQGISSFFSNHVCNEFCKSDWSMPNDRTRYFRPQQGTSMIATGANRHVPTRSSRTNLY